MSSNRATSALGQPGTGLQLLSAIADGRHAYAANSSLFSPRAKEKSLCGSAALTHTATLCLASYPDFGPPHFSSRRLHSRGLPDHGLAASDK